MDAHDLRHVVSDAPRLLVVDGSKLVRKLIGDVLRRELPNADVIACDGLASARAVLEAAPVDLVTTALLLPDGDGLALARVVREAGGQSYVPVIVVSGDVQARLESRNLGDDVTDYFDKSLGHSALAAFIRGYVQPQPVPGARVLYVEDSRVVAAENKRMPARHEIEVTNAIHIEDAQLREEAEDPDVRAMVKRNNFRSALIVPMLRDDRAIGTLSLFRYVLRPFSATEIDLVKTFADQAVIAIENVRLFNETKEALERQTATAEILRVISSSPNDVQPVFDAIAKRARLLCAADSSAVRLPDGDVLRVRARDLSEKALAKCGSMGWRRRSRSRWRAARTAAARSPTTMLRGAGRSWVTGTAGQRIGMCP